MTATRREILDWAADRAQPWTLAECAEATRPNTPEDLAVAGVRQVVQPMLRLGWIEQVGSVGSFGALTYTITRTGYRIARGVEG